MTIVSTTTSGDPNSSTHTLAAACAATLLLLAPLRADAQPADANDPSPSFTLQRIGPEPFHHPTITNVQIADLDGDGVNDVVVTDAQNDAVYAYYRTEDGGWREQTLVEDVVAPAHATIVDLDQDGDNDVVVSLLGNLYPDDTVVGSLILLDNRGDGTFEKKLLLDDVRRVVDAQPGDFDGDGDIDLAVAVFGYLRGQVLWLENTGDGFIDHELLSRAGTIHVPVADYDNDGDLDIAAVVSQDDEEVWIFENLGDGQFKPHRVWFTTNFDIGSAGLVKSDVDGDGDMDLLLPVGDNLEDSYSVPQPYHGCFYLENKGDWQFDARRIATFSGTYAADAGDIDHDGDVDVVLASMVYNWNSPNAPSLVWLENDGQQQFTQHAIAKSPNMLVTVAAGDINNDGRDDIVAGGLHMYPPFDRLGRISAWVVGPGSAGDTAEAQMTEAGAMGPLASAEQTPPLPDLTLIDAVRGHELQKLYDDVNAKLEAGEDRCADWVALGRGYYAEGFFPDALRCFKLGVERDPNDFMANYLYGVSLQRLGNLSAALAQFAKTEPLATGNHNAWVWYEIGRCHLRLEHPDEAEAALVKAGNQYSALAHLARLRLKMGQYEQAMAAVDALAKVQPGTTEMFIFGARAAEGLNQPQQAQVFRDRAEYNSQTLKHDPVTLMAFETRTRYDSWDTGTRIRVLIQQQRWEDAAQLLERMYESVQDTGTVLLLAVTETKRGNHQHAIELLEGLGRRRSADNVGTLTLGDAYLGAGQPDKAEAAWKKGATFNPSPDFHQRLADLYEQQGKTDAARRQRALALRNSGIASLRNASPAIAQGVLQKAVDLEPAMPKAWFYLGECRRLLGDTDAAIEAYRKTLEYDPYHGRALSRLQMLGQ